MCVKNTWCGTDIIIIMVNEKSLSLLAQKEELDKFMGENRNEDQKDAVIEVTNMSWNSPCGLYSSASAFIREHAGLCGSSGMQILSAGLLSVYDVQKHQRGLGNMPIQSL